MITKKPVTLQERAAAQGRYIQVFGQTQDEGHAVFYTHCPAEMLPGLHEPMGPLSREIVGQRLDELGQRP